MRDVNFGNALPGIHNVTAAVHAIAGDSSYPWYVQTKQVNVLTTNDTDGDGIPDMLEGQMCGRARTRDIIDNQTMNEAGHCNSPSDYVPPAGSKTISLSGIPSNVTSGPDNDTDRFPAYVDVHYVNITIDRTGPIPPTITYAGRTRIVVDTNDADANTPAISVVCNPVGIPTAVVPSSTDADHDGVPAYVVITYAKVCVDRRTTAPPVVTFTQESRTVDPDDNDPNKPVPPTVSVPVLTFTTFDLNNSRQDKDNDGVIAGVSRTTTTYTFDRRDPGHFTTTNSTQVTQIDPDDNNRDNPVPWSKVDLDGDFIPDAAEAWICASGLENQNDDTDGSCAGANYTAPSWYRKWLTPITG